MDVVVIDDEVEVRNLIGDALSDNGHKIYLANDGRAGLELITSLKPDLVISDFQMPNLNGGELVEIVRNLNNELSVIPIILMSGKFNASSEISHLNNGVDICFRKPFNINELVAYVNSISDRKTREDALFKSRVEKIGDSISGLVGREIKNISKIQGSVPDYVSKFAGFYKR